jgi:hypothetical protein
LITSDAIYPGQGQIGQPVSVTFTSQLPGSGAVEFTYRVSYGDPQTISAGLDGTATVTFTPDSPWSFVYVTARTSDGLVSGEAYESLNIQP